MSASTAPVPETMEGLRRQNSAYRALCASLEATQAIHTERGRKYQEAITTLDSEREANAMMTDRIAELEAALQACADAPHSGWTIAQALARASLNPSARSE